MSSLRKEGCGGLCDGSVCCSGRQKVNVVSSVNDRVLDAVDESDEAVEKFFVLSVLIMLVIIVQVT
jgi:hypothetical protein